LVRFNTRTLKKGRQKDDLFGNIKELQPAAARRRTAAVAAGPYEAGLHIKRRDESQSERARPIKP
jgi:hypothetical protein